MIEKNNHKKFAESYKTYGPYLGLGTQLAATVILMFFLGRWIDYQIKTFPVFLILFSLIGAFAGIYNFINTVLKLNKKNKIDK